MSLPDLIIRYQRDEGDTCTGELLIRYMDGSNPSKQLRELTRVGFNKMMALVSDILNDRPIGNLIMERLDRAGLKPFVFDTETKEKLRTDPVAVIQSMNVPAIHIDLRKNKAAPVKAVFTVGYDTLAESFGEEVYARVRKGEVECPGCGRWSRVTGDFVFTCKRTCSIRVAVRFVEKWAVFKVPQLLDCNLPRYYLPRGWNKTGGFISADELLATHTRWNKEKTS